MRLSFQGFARVLIVVAVAAMVSLPTVASAEATVQVQVRSADGEVVDGTVTLRGAEDRTYSCTTEDGRCTLEDVVGGLYVVTLVRTTGPSPDPRTVMIAPTGSVDLHISAD